nr:MAG TPA: hypothetical protein [Caudoviricetes sp.]
MEISKYINCISGGGIGRRTYKLSKIFTVDGLCRSEG